MLNNKQIVKLIRKYRQYFNREGLKPDPEGKYTDVDLIIQMGIMIGRNQTLTNLEYMIKNDITEF